MIDAEFKIFDDAMKQLMEWEREVSDYNLSIIKPLCASALKNFTELIDGCHVNGKIEIVESPSGDFQKGEKYGVFRKVYVDQGSVGDSGDSFAGFIYTNYGKRGTWLKIPYEC